MWFFSGLADQFRSMANWSDTAGSRFDSIPVVGVFGGSPFHVIASICYNLAMYASNASAWSDSVASSVSAAVIQAQNAYSYAAGTVLSTARNALSRANDAYSYASGVVYSLASEAQRSANNAYTYAAGYVTGLANNAMSQAVGAYNYAQSVSSRIGSDAWSYILSGRLQAYLDGWKNTVLNDAVTWIAGRAEFIIPSLFTAVDRYWSAFAESFAWLTAKIIALVADRASVFAPMLWSLFESLVKELTEWKGE